MASSELPPTECVQIPVPCDASDTGEPGKHDCTVSRKTLCNNGEDINAKLPKEHKVDPVVEVASYEDLECSLHGNKNVTLYCKRCQCSNKTDTDVPPTTKQSSPVLQRPSTEQLTLPNMLMEINLQSLTLIAPQILTSFKTEIQFFPCICITKNGNAWIGGRDSWKLILVNGNGKIINRRNITHRPHDMAIMASGDIIISPNSIDSVSVVRLGTDGTETVIYDAAPLMSNGVSVTSDQQILICVGKEKVMKCCGDGTNVQEIYNKGRPDSALFAIEGPDKTICISDWSIRGLVIIDRDGQPITTILQPLEVASYQPMGLVCDRMGNILSVDDINECVYIIDQKRQVMELVGPSYGLKKPKRVAIDPDDNLWIAQEDGTITVVKYLA